MDQIEPRRNTIQTSSLIHGVGIHSGQRCAVTLSPARAGAGIMFNGTRLNHELVESAHLATVIQTQGGRVSTIEHLCAAIVGQGVDDVEVSVEGGEVPVLDGTALPWAPYLQPAPSEPLAEASLVVLERVVEVSEGDSYIRAEPCDRLMIEVEVDYPHIGAFTYSGEASQWMRAGSARTFGFVEHHAALLERGLAQGAGLDNTLVFGHDGRPLNDGGLRTPDEVARHKWIDCLGDLALLGGRLLAKVRVVRGGHRLHHQLVAAILEREN